MINSVLEKIITEGRLKQCSITVSDKNAMNNRKTIFGRDIIRVTRSCIEYLGGETGYEKFTIPLESVLAVELEGRQVFSKKERVEKIFPRK